MERKTDNLGGQAHAVMLEKERRSNNAWNKIKRNKTAMVGLFIVIFMMLLVVFADILAPYDPNELSLGNTYLKPGSPGHILELMNLVETFLAGLSMVQEFQS